MPTIWLKHGTATSTGTGRNLVRIPHIQHGSTFADFANSSNWTPNSSDVKLSKDGGALTIIAANPDFANGAWEYQFTSGELEAKVVDVRILDVGTRAILDDWIKIFTYGHSSAYWVIDPEDGIRFGLSALPNATAGASSGLVLVGDSSGNIKGIAGSKNDLDDLNDLTAATVANQLSSELTTMALDRLITAAVGSSDVVIGSIIARLAVSGSSGRWGEFISSSHSLEAIAGKAGLTESQVAAQVSSELKNISLDHLLSAAAGSSEVVVGSVIARLAASGSSGAWSDFISSSHSLEAIAGKAGLTESQVAAQVSSELKNISLDHLLSVAAGSSEAVIGSIIARLAASGSSGAWQDFVSSSHALQVIADKSGLTESQVAAQLSSELKNINLDHLLATAAGSSDVLTGSVIARLALSGSSGKWGEFVSSSESLQVIAEAAGLTEAQVAAQVSSELKNISLDHLLSVAAGSSEAVAGSIVARLAASGSSGQWQEFLSSSHSLQAIAVGQDSITATISSQDKGDISSEVWDASTRTLTDLSPSVVASQVSSELKTIGLDHLLNTAAGSSEAAIGSIISRLVASGSSGRWQDFLSSSHALQALRSNQISSGNLNDITAGDVWGHSTRALTDKAGFTLTAAERGKISTAVWGFSSRVIDDGTIGTVNDKTGYGLSSTGIKSIWDDANISAPSSVPGFSSDISPASAMGWITALNIHPVLSDPSTMVIRTLGDSSDLATAEVTDSSSETKRAKWS